MNQAYETVIDPSTIVWTLAAMLIHGAIIAAQLGLSGFLFTTGIHNLFFPDSESPLMLRLGSLRMPASSARPIGAARIGLGLGMLLPLLTGISFVISFVAGIATLLLLLVVERRISPGSAPGGRFPRRTAMASALFVSVFMLWEGEDGLDLGVELIANAQFWRVHELDWQLENDLEAPKVGELAPDFELQDPAGESVIRLSDFRGKRPVALIFGSYT